MARGFRFGGAGNSTTSHRFYIYKNGTWSVPYDNASRTWSGATTQGWTLNATNMTSNSVSIISTEAAIDVSKYTTLHAMILMPTSIAYSSIAISTSRQPANVVRESTRFSADPNPVEYTLDVSDRTAAFILLLGYQSGITCTEIWLD